MPLSHLPPRTLGFAIMPRAADPNVPPDEQERFALLERVFRSRTLPVLSIASKMDSFNVAPIWSEACLWAISRGMQKEFPVYSELPTTNIYRVLQRGGVTVGSNYFTFVTPKPL